ncbi:carbonic anhydrase [Streptomyces sp. NPDC048506]|uniref:carbonic anhydrase n=1 Tax=Streptomyces sp. NPDC048506 TaxID=3155028 RepID=UPI003424B2B8
MHDLTEGLTRFQRDVFPARADLFAHLATHHMPHTLFISCSDARVVPELICGSEPGELFVIRTAGNLVPAYGTGADAVAASIEYAVAVLGVTAIVVCGHSSCGAMTALVEGRDLSDAPAVADWLRYADASRARTTVPDDVPALVRANVLAQLANLATHPSVARAMTEHQMTLHGWVFDIASGHVDELDAAGSTAAPAESTAVSAGSTAVSAR